MCNKFLNRKLNFIKNSWFLTVFYFSASLIFIAVATFSIVFVPIMKVGNMLIWITPLGIFLGLILYKIFFNGFKVEV